MKLALNVIGICLLCFMNSCGEKLSDVEKALEVAGENRGELEKVLNHYSQKDSDSLKLKAARFLIENMPGHYTLTGKLIDEYRRQIYADTTVSYLAKRSLELVLDDVDLFQRNAIRQEDVKFVSADFLIHHIDETFERLETYPWLADLPFEMFLEFVLPYRIGHEHLDLWIDSLKVLPNVLENIQHSGENKYSIWNDTKGLALTNSSTSFTPEQIMQWFHSYVYHDCIPIALKDNFRYKAAFIPSAIDFIPAYANRNGFHYWCTVLSPEIKIIAKERGFLERRAPKVYRKTFSRQNEICPYDGEYVPALFREPFYVDVTEHYVYTADVTVPVFVELTKNNRYAYLCVFNTMTWEPVAIAEVNKQGILFPALGKSIVYLPIFYDKEGKKALCYPFLLNLDGKPEYFVPDTTKKQSLRLMRKYPWNEHLHRLREQLLDIIIEASNDPTFRKKDTIANSLLRVDCHLETPIKSKKTYRYVKVIFPQNVRCAEIVFFDSAGERLKGKITAMWEAAFDNDPLTTINTYKKREIVIDFGREILLSDVIVLPASDGNGIYPGDTYELFYHDLTGWKSLGKRIATTYSLDYENVPTNALFWLHNWSRGKEERIFTVGKNGRIRFW